jgi:hypothetical protein
VFFEDAARKGRAFPQIKRHSREEDATISIIYNLIFWLSPLSSGAAPVTMDFSEL